MGAANCFGAAAGALPAVSPTLRILLHALPLLGDKTTTGFGTNTLPCKGTNDDVLTGLNVCPW